MSPSVGRGSPMRDGSNSPARGRRSPRRRSERSPVRPRSSPRARSPVRTTSRARSPKLPSPPTRSPSPRTKRLRRAQLEKEADRGRARSPAREKRDRSPKLPSPPSRSPSPRTKRLRRAHLEKEADRGSDRERGRNNIREDGDKERHDGVNDRERGRNIIREGEKERHGRVSDRERGRDGSRERDKERHERVSAREHGRDGGREERRRDGSWEERVTDGEHGRDGGWEERRRVGSREHSDKERRYKEVSVDRSDRRSSRDKKDGESEKRSRHRSSPSPVDRRHSNRHNSHSPSRASRGGARDEVINPSEDVHRDENDSIARMKAAAESLEEKQKQKPSFELSGKLAEETNRVKGVTLLFTEPSDARKPDVRWRLYVFKGGEALNEPLYIHRQTCYLFGRERRVADVPTDHPSCSKQHAVIQYRQVEVEKPDGMLSKQVRPYIMDLGSTNGTFINDNRIESQRYYELFEKDTIKFGNSRTNRKMQTRMYSRDLLTAPTSDRKSGVCHAARELSVAVYVDLMFGFCWLRLQDHILLQQREVLYHISLQQLKVPHVVSSLLSRDRVVTSTDLILQHDGVYSFGFSTNLCQLLHIDPCE